MKLSRREFGAVSAVALSASMLDAEVGKTSKPFKLNYVLGSPMYGTTPLAEVIAEAPKTGAKVIDVWPRSHADHREQMDKLGHDKVEELLAEHDVKLGMITRYDLGPFKLAGEMEVLQRFGGKLLVCGAKSAPGDSLKERMGNFVEQLKPHVELAAEHGLKIGIENHAGSLLNTPDSIKYFAEFSKEQKLTPHLGLALAPYHLPQDPNLIAGLIESLGNDGLVFFQGWQHGEGCMKKLPKEKELLQMPGRGSLDFKPIIGALRKIGYDGWTEIFMHPVPRGIPILQSTSAVTAEISRSREYLEKCYVEK